MNFDYEVDPTDFTVRVWISKEGEARPEEPSLLQPFNPNGNADAWVSAEEATAWVEQWITDAKNPPTPTPAPVEETPAE